MQFDAEYLWLCNFRNSGQQLKVRLGEWDASVSTEPIAAQEFFVSRIFVHPSYISSSLRNDIALLRLSSPVPLGVTPTISTVCLPSNQISNTRCWVAGKWKKLSEAKKLIFLLTGWGRNDFSNNGAYQAIMKEVDIPLVDQSSCQTQLRATRLGSNFLLDTTSFICAGGENGRGNLINVSRTCFQFFFTLRCMHWRWRKSVGLPIGR